MKQGENFNIDEFVSKVLNSAIENRLWQVEQMQTALQKIGEAKKLVMLLMDYYKVGKMYGDKISDNLWLMLDEADCRLMEAIIALSETVNLVI